MALTTEQYREGLTGKESFLISTLARSDKKFFTIEDAKAIAGEQAVRMLVNLVKKKWILKLKRGLYIIVPLDIGVKGADSFIMHNFAIASKLVEPYYIGYWSALNYYGYSDQIPQATFIATTKARKGLEILNASYVFVQVSKSRFFGTSDIEIDGEKVKISDKNKTIADCLDHPEHSGGIDEIARSIFFSIDEIDIKKIVRYALKMGNVTIIKRLGYILEACGLLEKYEAVFSNIKLSKGYGLLDPMVPEKGKYNEKWMLLINRDLNPERWMY
ncbi:MAG: hypothetical protein GXO64_03715 [Candidatus Micrarchaeota archaeon]|nr:hypothetical protein [Candidatus Micrarchaeota archaeon]